MRHAAILLLAILSGCASSAVSPRSPSSAGTQNYLCKPASDRGPAIALDITIHGASGPVVDPAQVQIAARPADPTLTYSVTGFDNKLAGAIVISGQARVAERTLGPFALIMSSETDNPNARLTTAAKGFTSIDYECREK